MFDRFWQRNAAVVVLLAALTPMAPAAVAQQIDPRVLQQLGTSGAGPTPSQRLDAAREQGEDTAVAPQRPTAEERELRRQQSRNELQALYEPSRIESEFRARTGDSELRLFGYDLFKSTEGAPSTLTGAVGGNYILGVGDELIVAFQGATNSSATARVDREGRLIVGQLPPVRAAGRSLGDVGSELSAATRRTLLGTDVSVSLGSVRSITVLVGGEVERPGQYQVTALSDLTTALAKAGGIRRGGTLRNVRILRTSGAVMAVDLYGLLGIGIPPRVSLQDGDRVIVPVIGDTVAVSGSVVRPGIYELRGRMGVQSLVEYAGGALRPRGYDLTVSRIGADGRENFIRAIGSAQMLVAGDTVQVIAGSGGGVEGRVSLRGSVVNPGVRPLAAARTVRELLGESSELRSGTYLPMAVLVRRDPVTSADVFQPVNLIEALKDAPAVPTRNEDRLYVFSEADIQFLSRPAVRRVLLGKAGSTQCRALQRLEALVNAGGQSQGTTRVAGTETATESANIGVGASSEQCPAVFEENVDLLPLLIESSVGIGGAVRRPGSYPIAAGISAELLVAVSGGLTAQASDVRLDVIRSKTGIVQMLSVTTGGDSNELAALTLLPGDNLRVNASQPQLELGSVLLSGEFQRPGLYAIRAGETLGQLIARAGGLTTYAYPYGAIFTRRSVKESQQEGFRRAARELNDGLLVASTRKSGAGSDSLAAAAVLVDRLAEVEAPGRVVVEADPRILSARADLDTILESGDALVMPKRPNFVLALGDVLSPGALQFTPGKSPQDYLRDAGGPQAGADQGRAFLVLPNGTARAIRSSVWRRDDMIVPPGSTIIVPKDLNPLRTLDLARDVTTIFGQFVTAIASVAILAAK